MPKDSQKMLVCASQNCYTLFVILLWKMVLKDRKNNILLLFANFYQHILIIPKQTMLNVIRNVAILHMWRMDWKTLPKKPVFNCNEMWLEASAYKYNIMEFNIQSCFKQIRGGLKTFLCVCAPFLTFTKNVEISTPN